jgi:hypothetical protein
MTCQSCHKVYIGQTGRNLRTRYKEHIRNITFNKEESAFAQHILGQSHQYRPMEQIMEMIKYVRKGNIMNIKGNENQSSMFDTVKSHAYTPTRAPHGKRV